MTKLIPLAVLLATTATLRAENLEEKKFWKQESERIDRSIKKTNEVCGTKLEFEFLDKPKLRASAEAEKTKSSPYGVCDRVVNLVHSICLGGDDEKQAVLAGIKKIQCGFSNPWKLDLKAGTVVFHGNNTQYNFSEWAKPLLMKKL